MDKEAKKPYQTKNRKMGEGNLRIGTSLNLVEDIYCMTFLCYLRTDIMERFIYFETGELHTEREERL
jgi:hypothetical protein